jgi:redox-sensitive bicupin YhaK (pirin superfamily)
MEKEYSLHTSESRGFADHGWLKSAHTFSFANYHNPSRVHFGVLRVLNDDYVAPGKGFGTHPHENMEIISIPLFGDLEHQDSMGNKSTIKKGDIQVMSAGTGIYHSEYNPNQDKQVEFLQIWIFPKQKNVTPRYDQVSLNLEDRKNRLQQILSPNAEDEGVWIHQDAWFHLGNFDKNTTINYSLNKNGNGIYLFVIEGNVKIDEIELNKRDGLGIKNGSEITLTSLSDNTEVLLMEVPMHV